MLHSLADLSHFLKNQAHVEDHPENGQKWLKMLVMGGQKKYDHLHLYVSATVLEVPLQFHFFAERRRKVTAGYYYEKCMISNLF